MNFIPFEDEVGFGDNIKYPAPYTLESLFSPLSPELPLHYDKNLLPADICEKEIIKLTQCLMFHRTDKQTLCRLQASRFQVCRNHRDILIFDSIKEWEAKHVQSLDKSNQRMYLQGLKFKRDRLQEEYGKVPSTVSKQFKMLELQSRISQLKWRINNINKII